MAAEDATRYPFERTEAVEIASHPWVIAVLTPFILVFLWAAWLEFRRWWIYGPAKNKRAAFPIDPTAPSYDLPEPDTSTTQDEQDEKEQGKRK
ncbi:hypothetical protein [Roseovarius salinarum]|uniref:hypothetical protein n=1 Tax=Roseovarius salinarum TaxID=1981892 RepID=UPI000C34D261|nr:hypothetical protein [Roseovarius salinarum]